MKIRSRRLMALMLSVAMVFPAAPGASAAETQESLQSQAPVEIQTQPAPETAAETQPQTAAETQAQTAAETQPQTAAETQAQSASETQAAPETQAQSTSETQSTAETQPQQQEHTDPGAQISETSETSELQFETEAEKDKKEEKGSFEAKADGVSLKLTLPKGERLPADIKLTLKTSDAKSGQKQTVLVRKALEKAQHTVEKVRLLTITAVDKDGKAVTLPKGTTLSFSFGNGLDLGIAERREGQIHFLAMGDQASDAGASLKLSQDQTKLVSASVSLGSEGKESLTYAAASLQNRKNSGGKLSAGDVNGFAGAGAYAAVAEHFDGKKDEKIQVLAGDNGKDDKEKEENLKKAQSLLGQLASFSASLADAQDSDSVRVVNLYADDGGNVNTAADAVTDPMYGVKAADGTIDVSSGYVVVNIIAKSTNQSIHIPDFAVTYSENGKAQAVTADAHPELARHLIVNIAAGNGKDGKNFSLVSYTGTADRGGAAGVYLAPAGTIRFAGVLTGAVYAKNAAVDGKLSYATEADQAGKAKEDTEEAATEKASAALMEETAAEASQNAADNTADNRTAFSGALKVNAVRKNTDNTQTELEGVVFSLYERTDGQTDAQRDQLVYSWTSGEEAKQIPAGLLKEGGTYVVREEAMPVSENSTGNAGTVAYVKLAETVFTVTAASTGTAAGIQLTGNNNGGTLKLLMEGGSDYELDYIHKSSQTPETPQNLVTIEAKDPSGTGVPGSQVTIERQTSETDASENAQWEQVSAFTMQGKTVAFDFGSNLPEKKDDSQPKEDTAVFRITERAPAGMTSLAYGDDSKAQKTEQASTTLTFTYKVDQDAGWKLTSRTRVYADGVGTDITDKDKVTSVTFADAYLISLTSSQVNYYSKESDEKTLVQNLAGASIAVQVGGASLNAGTDYLVYTVKDGKADQKQTVSDGSESFTMPGDPVQMVLLSGKAGDGKSVGVTGTWEKDSRYHFIKVGNENPGTASGTLTAPAEGKTGTYSSQIPALTLKSRIQAVVNLSSVDDAGKAHLSGESGTVMAKVAGTAGEIKTNPTAFVMNDPNLDDEVIGMLQTGLNEQTTHIVGTQNWNGYAFNPMNGIITGTNQASDGSGVAINAKLDSQSTVGTIVVYMDLYRASTGKRLPVTVQKQYQVRVFMDAGGTLPYGDAQTLTVSKNNSTSGTNGSARFTVPVDALHGTTYYVYEVDAEGKPIKNSSDMKIQIQGGDRTSGNGAAVTMKAMEVDSYGNGAKRTYVVTNKTIRIQNLYTDSYYNAHRNEFMSNGTFDIQLRVVDASGNELPVDNLVAEFRVRTRDGKLALKNNQRITLKNTSVGERKGISFPVPIGGRQLMSVTLMSIRTTAGVSLAGDYTLLTDYTRLTDYTQLKNLINLNFSKVGSRTGERTFTINADAENQGPVVFVLRKNDSNEKASLTLTKSVMYKKTPIRVNATYYIGIFADAAHTKLLFKKAMSLKDASSMSDTLKVNINSQKGRTITLYFAETDRNGKVVESGKKTGYNISISSPQVTLSQSNMSASVTVTNEILDGSRAAERLTDPDSGFAGDSAALADAQALASSSNLNSKTGDDSPLTRYVLLLVIAGAGVAAGLYLALRRRKA